MRNKAKCRNLLVSKSLSVEPKFLVNYCILARKRIPGDSISGAFVKIRDGNVQESDANGQLSFPVPGGKYYIDSVKYKDYQLVDSDELGKEQAFSEKPKSIVIASILKMNEDLYNEEKRLRELADKRYRNAMSKIRRLQEENKISSDSIQVLLIKLNASREKEEELIKDFAERYSIIDFYNIDDFNIEWALYIRTGQLDKADSLLNTRGDLSTMEEEYTAMCKEVEHGRTAIRHQEDLLQQNKETQAGNEQNLQNKRAELADTYYKQYELAVSRYKYDEAATCLEKRANLDPENADWQFDAALYFHQQNQFKDSEIYCKRSLNIYRRLATANPQAYEPYVAWSFNNLASLYSDTQRFNESETMHKEALEITAGLRRRIRRRTSRTWRGLSTIWQVSIPIPNGSTKARRCTRKPWKYTAGLRRRIRRRTSHTWRTLSTIWQVCIRC